MIHVLFTLLDDELINRLQFRQALLKAAGVPCEAIPADIDERAIQAGSGLKNPAASKAAHVAARRTGEGT